MKRIRISVVFYLLFISMSVFVSCSQEDVLNVSGSDDSSPAVPSDATRALSDIFNVECVAPPGEAFMWVDGPRGVDNEGNFYCVLYESGFGEEYIFKYNLETGIFAPFAPIDAIEWLGGEFCFDERNNLCYLIVNDVTGKFGIRRVRADGNAVTEQWLQLPGNVTPSSICTASNGNIFLLAYSEGAAKIYKFTSNGVLSELPVDLSGFNGGGALYKANGATLYLLDNAWHKINVNTNNIEKLTLVTGYNRTFTSSKNKANLYMLDNNCVVQLRPNAANNLVIASIPSSYKNSDGEFVNMGVYDELYMNSDATVFYSILHSADYGFYKLTLN